MCSWNIILCSLSFFYIFQSFKESWPEVLSAYEVEINKKEQAGSDQQAPEYPEEEIDMDKLDEELEDGKLLLLSCLLAMTEICFALNIY